MLRATVFCTPVYTSFPHMFWNFQTQVIQDQVTRSRQKTSPQKKKFECSIAEPNDRSPWNFERLTSVTVSIKCLFRNFDLDYLRSCQFCDLSIISQWEKKERHLFWTKAMLNTIQNQVTGRLDNLSRNIATSDPSSFCQGHLTGHRAPTVIRQEHLIETS